MSMDVFEWKCFGYQLCKISPISIMKQLSIAIKLNCTSEKKNIKDKGTTAKIIKFDYI